MAGGNDTCTLYVQGLSSDTSQDALELHIENITGAEVEDVRYMNGKTEAFVKLNETIKFDSEIFCTISDKDVKIVSLHTKRKITDPTRRHMEVDMVPVPTRSLVEEVMEDPTEKDHTERSLEECIVPDPTRRSVEEDPTRRSLEEYIVPIPTQRPVEEVMGEDHIRRSLEEHVVPVPTQRPVEEVMEDPTEDNRTERSLEEYIVPDPTQRPVEEVLEDPTEDDHTQRSLEEYIVPDPTQRPEEDVMEDPTEDDHTERSLEEYIVPDPTQRPVEEVMEDPTEDDHRQRSLEEYIVHVPTRMPVEEVMEEDHTRRSLEEYIDPDHTRRLVEEEDMVAVPTRKSLEEDMVHVPTRQPEDRSVEKNNVPALPGSEDLHKEKTDCAASPRAQAPRCPSPEESNVTELVRCSPMKCDLLKVMLPDLQLSLPNYSLKIVTEGIKLHSASGSVKEAKLKISEQVFKFDSHAISDMDSQRAKLLMSDGGQQQVQKLFSKARIQAMLSVTDDQLWLTAADSSKNVEASEILEKSVHSFEIPVEDFHQEYLQSTECKHFIEDLEHKYTVLVEKGRSKLVVEALGNCTEEIQKQIHDRLEVHAKCTEEIHLKVEDWELLNAHHKETVEALGRADGTRSMQVTLTTLPSREGVIQVSGHARLLQDVKTAVKDLVGRIIHKKVKFSIPGLFKFMDEGSGSMMIHGIQLSSKSLFLVSEEKDTDEIGGEIDEAIETKIVAEHCKEKEVETATLAESYTKTKETEREPKVTLEVKQGDLTQFTADVLVNTPASKDKDLAKCGQVCRAFCKVGGEQMQKLYDEAINDGDDVVVTQACGNLKCSHVFHMHLHSLKTDTYEKLEGQIYGCLQKASELKAKSVVFPTVGCGKLRYNPVAVVQCFKRAIKKHASNDTCCISKVIIAAYGEGTCQQFEQMLSVAASAMPPPVEAYRKEDKKTWRTTEDDSKRGKEMASKVVLEVKQGDLTKLQFDVLVNTPASKDKDLTKCGQVCRAFCTVGGEKMQELYEEAIGDDEEDVVVMQACGNLKCSHVFHMRILPTKAVSYQKLEDQIYRCLQKASELQADSIAFPTVGCGKLRYDPSAVGQCFKRAIKKHASNETCCVSKVIVVAFDDQMYQDFVKILNVPHPRPLTSAKERRLPGHRHHRRTTPTSSVKGRISPFGQSVTVFHISALEKACIDKAVSEINKSVDNYSAEENVPAEYVANFSQCDIDDITSLSCEDMQIIIDKQSKCIRIVGAKQAVSATAAVVTQKVQAIEKGPEFVRQTRGQPAYLECIANQPVEIPGHWKSVRTLQDERTVKMPVDPTVAKAIEDIVQRTWDQKLVGRGRDADDLTHKTIEVTKVEQIENPHLYMSYEQARKKCCTRAAKGSFPKVTSEPGEKDVLTSTLNISALDEQLIPEINEHFLFHGARQDYIESIIKQGIDFRLTKRVMFGKGAYFCESSTKADQYADAKGSRTTGPHSMFLVKVFLGHSYIAKKPNEDLSRPPCVHHCKDSCKHDQNDFFDSVMGTHRDNGSRLLFREFIIYERSQIYPAYIITYKRK